MPHWGRPPGGATGVGRYFEGVEDDVHRFQELDTDDEKNGVLLDPGFQQVSNSTNINPDELYFSDMDIRSWERRASALDGTAYGPEYGYEEEDEGYYDDTGESMTHAEYEEMLFRRVLDKIRIARAAGHADVQLSPEEVEAYQSKVYGAKAPAARPQPKPRPSGTFVANDTASVITTSKSGNAVSGSSRAKKSQQRTSLFGTKPKKEKPSGRKRTSTLSSASSQVAPGFVVPGPDGQPVYAPINAYQGSLLRDAGPVPRPASRSASDTSYQTPTPPRATPPRDVLGAFPGSEHTYRPATPPWQGRPTSSRQPMQGHELAPVNRDRSSSIQSAGLVPFPVEPYQYHAFSPSSSSPTSPQAQYARRVSSGLSEASYTSMPRRVPVPAPAPVPLQRTALVTGIQGSHFDPTVATQASGSRTAASAVGDDQGATKMPGHAKDGERKRKGGRKKKG
ncbi:Nn.00g099590.m01.CDS01 [Neocucurbitaria sp. VM-36]